jgi:hypothetical protein
MCEAWKTPALEGLRGRRPIRGKAARLKRRISGDLRLQAAEQQMTKRKEVLKFMEATRVTTDEIRERMKKGEPFTFIDARNPTAWSEAVEKLPGAIRVPADEVASHLAEIPGDRVIITYCT